VVSCVVSNSDHKPPMLQLVDMTNLLEVVIVYMLLVFEILF